MEAFEALGGALPNSPPSTGRAGGADRHRLGRDRWFTAAEAVAYGLADEIIGSPADAPESGTPA
ncbi:ATP-dependent Clp protease proteolytic subunit [Planotetraspora kaengkrachanensis]|uniref:ATP-dependent Clp protease proteolytic subunit n=1 Tax=Planotetraspora kaengkrachanensis TaxID=575193 RepID=UPI001941D9F9